MSPQNSAYEEFERREQALREREQALRLRELEAEINQVHVETVKHQEPQKIWSQRYRQALTAAKFLGIVIAVVVAVRIASWLATAVIIGGIAWIVYLILFRGDRTKR